MRKGMGLAGLMALVVGSPGWGGESSRGPLGRPVRFLTRSEAIGLALENMAADLSDWRCEVIWLGRDELDHPQRAKKSASVPTLKVHSRTAGKHPELVVTGLSCPSARAEIDRRLNSLLFNVETAYWNLYGSYWTLYSREQGLRFAHQAWNIVRVRFQSGRVGLADLAQAQGQYELFRSQRLTAIDQLLDNERQLRELLGMKVEDGTRLAPSDAPMLEEVEPSWSAALKEARKRRPELQIAREHLGFSQMRLAQAEKNRFSAGPKFTLPSDILPGGRADGPCRQAQHQVALGRLQLQDQELKIERFLGLQYRRIIDTYQQIKAQHAQRDAFALQVKLRSQAFQAGKGTLDQMLEAQRFCADALANECQAIVSYNNALAAFDFAQGRSQDRHHLTVCTDSSEKDPAPAKARQACPQGGDDWGQEVSEERETCDPSFTLPDLWEKTPPLKEVGPLPQVRELKQGQGLTEQDIDEVLPPPREANSETDAPPSK